MTPECCQALTMLQRGQNDFQDLLDVGAGLAHSCELCGSVACCSSVALMGWLLCMPDSSSRARRRLIRAGSSLVLRCAIDTPAQFQMALCWKRCCTAAGSVCKTDVHATAGSGAMSYSRKCSNCAAMLLSTVLQCLLCTQRRPSGFAGVLSGLHDLHGADICIAVCLLVACSAAGHALLAHQGTCLKLSRKDGSAGHLSWASSTQTLP